MDDHQQQILRQLPGVDRLMETVKSDPAYADVPKSVLVGSARQVLDTIRTAILSGPPMDADHGMSPSAVVEQVKQEINRQMAYNLAPLVNATGVVVHTNLGRSVLPDEAIANLTRVAATYSNLEFDLDAGKRGSRYSNVEDILCEISGSESAMVVNNNAGAVLLCLETLAKGRPVIVSRGELVEIGGSFRIPDVMAKSGAILTEVGTTNRTHLRDYRNAIEPETALLLKVHKSNYSIVGFSKEVTLAELVELGRQSHIPVMEDLGSGMFIDFSRYGLIKEPTVQESVSAGADVVTFSGDKLLGGPQAGIIVGKKKYLDQIKQNPITRALRIDKLTLAALESTLRLYRDPDKALQAIPTLRMLTQPIATIAHQSSVLANQLNQLSPKIQADTVDIISKVGGGALPLQKLPSKGVSVTVKGMSTSRLEQALRNHHPPVIGRIENDQYIMDMRTVREEDIKTIVNGFETIVNGAEKG